MFNLLKDKDMKKTILRLLKMTAIYSIWGIILQAFVVSILLASSPYDAQNLSEVKISITSSEITFEEALNIIEQKSGFNFSYLDDDLPLTQKVSIDVENETLYNILYAFASDYGIVFQRVNNQITVKKADPVKVEEPVVQPQSGTIIGTIRNTDTGEPLIMANIILKGTSIGTTTDEDGNFRIGNIAPGNYTLVVRYMGYATKEENITVQNNKSSLVNLSLEPSLVNLDEVMVTATLSKRKARSFPASVGVIRGEELENRNATNLDEVIESVAGILTLPGTESARNLTSVPTAYIRGATSANTVPIKYIVDGVEVSTSNIFNTMDPSNIEKIEILKGPMASTLYGSGAGSGVIAITTKSGKLSKTKINLRTMFSQTNNKYAAYDDGALRQEYKLNVSGGGEGFNYSFGSAYSLYPTTKLSELNNGIDQTRRSYYGKFHGRINNLSADLSINYGIHRSGSSKSSVTNANFQNDIGIETKVTPSTNLTDRERLYSSELISLHLSHVLGDDWYQDLTVGYNSYDNESHTYTARTYGYANTLSSSAKRSIRYFMFYNQKWSNLIKSAVTAGFEWSDYKQTSTSMYTEEQQDDNGTVYASPLENRHSLGMSKNSNFGWYSEIVTEYNNILFLTTGLRVDYNDNYGDNIGHYAMPRVGLTYVTGFSDFKIKPRICWGVSSEAPRASYKETKTKISGNYTYHYIGNPHIKPTRSEGIEFGADIFYGNNLSLDVTYFNQKTKDMIDDVSWYDENDSYIKYIHYVNIADAISKGFEITFTGRVNQFILNINYTRTTSEYGDVIVETETEIIHPHAAHQNIPKDMLYLQLTYLLPSFLPWTNKSGSIGLAWQYTGSFYGVNTIGYFKDSNAWRADPTLPMPNMNDYYEWQDGYSDLALQANCPVSDFANIFIYIRNLLDKQGSINSMTMAQRLGRTINFGFNINY
jgi:TonB-dependent SusC/RagA subfamily outer membrane receptor